MHQHFQRSLDERSRDISQGDRSDKGLPSHSRFLESRSRSKTSENEQPRRRKQGKQSEGKKNTHPHPTAHPLPPTHTPQKPTQQGRTRTRRKRAATRQHTSTGHHDAKTRTHKNQFLNSQAGSAAVRPATGSCDTFIIRDFAVALRPGLVD